MKKNISSKPQSRNASDRYLYFDLPCPPSLMEIWSLWSASRPTIARPTSEHLTPLQHSNTPTRRHLQTWSCDLLEPGSRDHTFSWRTQQGRRQNVSHIAKILHTHFTWTKHGIKLRWRDFYQWRCCDWKLRIEVRICCAIDPWCWAQLGRHQLLSVESQYKYHELRTLNCRLEPSWEEYRIHTTDEETLTFINHEWEHLRLCLSDKKYYYGQDWKYIVSCILLSIYLYLGFFFYHHFDILTI